MNNNEATIETEIDPFDLTTVGVEIDVETQAVHTIREHETFDFNGISVPFWAPEQTTIVNADGSTTVKSIAVPYVRNLQKFMETGSTTAFDNAILSMKKETLLNLVRGMSFRHKAWEAPVAVSNAIPFGHIYCDKRNGRIIINEMQATERYIDADGDRAWVLFNKAQTHCILVKYPITSQPLILQVWDTEPLESYYDFGTDQAADAINETPIKRLGVNVDAQDLFLKKHKDAKVGLLTNAWNCFDLWSSKSMSYSDKMEYLFNSHIDTESGKTQRAIDIEDGAMKAARKTGMDFQAAKVLEFGAGMAVTHNQAWALTSCSSIGTMQDFQVDFVRDANLKDMVKDILNLKVEFRKVKPTQPSKSKTYYVEGGFFKRLLAHKLIKYIDIPHRGKDMPASCVFWLTLPNGTPVALTDVKRDGREEGLTYAFVLAPVYDNLDIYYSSDDPTGEGRWKAGDIACPATHQWMHPMNHLWKVLKSFDSSIRRSYDDLPDHYFLQNGPQEWTNPKRAEKIDMLYKFLMEYCGKYGDPAPATKVNNVIETSVMADSTINRSLVIDYGSDMTDDEMWVVAQEAQEACNNQVCIVGSKGTSRRIRKYMLSNQWGGSILDKEGLASPHRAAMGRSQLLRALVPAKMTVAIVKMDTMMQVQITPSGIEKQRTVEAFLPQVFSTESKYHDYLKAHGLTTSESPATIVNYKTWQNDNRRCWTIGARNAIKIGKLIDEFGNKFMPRFTKQMVAINYNDMTSVDVDIVFPINELVDKDAHHVYLKGAVERDLVLEDGRTVKCMLLTKTLYRTGAASENVPPRWRMCSFKGIDSFPIWWQLNKIEPQPERVANTATAELLQKAIRSILARFNVRSEVDNSLDGEI